MQSFHPMILPAFPRSISSSWIPNYLGKKTDLEEPAQMIQDEFGEAVLICWHSQSYEIIFVVEHRLAAPPKLWPGANFAIVLV